MLTLNEIARTLGGDVNGRSARVPGPGHSPVDRSLSISLADNQDGFICYSFAGDDPIECKDYIRSKLGLPAFEPKRNGNSSARASEDDIAKAVMSAVAATSAPPIIEAQYDYTDADGTLLYQVLRLKPKAFRYRRPDGNGGWIDGRGDRIVPYRLPELLKYPDGTVFVCEGEKDADRAASLDLCSTNVASGGWEQCAPVMTGRDVIILRDSDEAGAKRALEAATALWGKAKTIRIVGMPDGAKDVSVWLGLDPGNAAKLATLCFDVPPWVPSPKEPRTTSPDTIQIKSGNLREVVDQSEAALINAGTPFYARSGELVKPIIEDVALSMSTACGIICLIRRIAEREGISAAGVIKRLLRAALVAERVAATDVQ